LIRGIILLSITIICPR